MTHARLVSLSLATLLLVACGSDSGGGGDDDDDTAGGPDATTPAGERYFPVAVGATWTYRVVQTGGSSGTKTQTVLALEDVGGAKAGTTAFRLRSDKPSGKYTISWQQDTGGSLVRHREQTFAADGSQETEEIYLPGKLRLDESAAHLEVGATYTTSYEEDVTDFTMGGAQNTISKTEQWTVVGVDVSVTVPAGTFDCIEIRRVNTVMGSDKSYWFARGVGKVREVGLGQTEELAAYTLP